MASARNNLREKWLGVKTALTPVRSSVKLSVCGARKLSMKSQLCFWSDLPSPLIGTTLPSDSCSGRPPKQEQGWPDSSALRWHCCSMDHLETRSQFINRRNCSNIQYFTPTLSSTPPYMRSRMCDPTWNL